MFYTFCPSSEFLYAPMNAIYWWVRHHLLLWHSDTYFFLTVPIILRSILLLAMFALVDNSSIRWSTPMVGLEKVDGMNHPIVVMQKKTRPITHMQSTIAVSSLSPFLLESNHWSNSHCRLVWCRCWYDILSELEWVSFYYLLFQSYWCNCPYRTRWLLFHY